MKAVLAACALALGSPQQGPVFPAGVEVVRVEVLVTRGGTPVRGLAAGDFELREDGVPQELQPIVAEETAVDAVLVLDLSTSVKGTRLEALKAAGRVFLDGLHEGERAALLAFHSEVRLLEPLTTDRAAVLLGLDAATSGGSTALVDAVYSALRLPALSDRRTALVVFSDGVDNISFLAASDVLEAARRSIAIAYAVRVRSPAEPRQRFLEDLVRATGGRLFEAAGERHLRERFLDVLGDIRARYVLRYTPGGERRPGWHVLDVRLRRGKADVLARPGYWRSAADGRE
jgi:VWFA-related protein